MGKGEKNKKTGPDAIVYQASSPPTSAGIPYECQCICDLAVPLLGQLSYFFCFIIIITIYYIYCYIIIYL